MKTSYADITYTSVITSLHINSKMGDQKQQMYMHQKSTGKLNPLSLLQSVEDRNLNEGCARGHNCLLPIIDI